MGIDRGAMIEGNFLWTNWVNPWAVISRTASPIPLRIAARKTACNFFMLDLGILSVNIGDQVVSTASIYPEYCQHQMVGRYHKKILLKNFM